MLSFSTSKSLRRIVKKVNQEMFRDIIQISGGKHSLSAYSNLRYTLAPKMLQELLSIKSIHIIGTNEILQCKQVVTKTEWLPICLEFLKWFLVYCSLNTNRNSYYRHCNSLHEKAKYWYGQSLPSFVMLWEKHHVPLLYNMQL